jgi:hypothetical protein
MPAHGAAWHYHKARSETWTRVPGFTGPPTGTARVFSQANQLHAFEPSETSLPQQAAYHSIVQPYVCKGTRLPRSRLGAVPSFISAPYLTSDNGNYGAHGLRAAMQSECVSLLEKTAVAKWGSGSVRTKNGGKGKTMATHRGKEALLQ